MQRRGRTMCWHEIPISYAVVTQQKCLCKSRLSTARSGNVCINWFVLRCTTANELLNTPLSENMDAVFFGIVILQVFTSVLSYPNGAPTSACVDMMPRHAGIKPQPNPAPYTIHPNSTTFQTGTPIKGRGQFG